MCAEETADYRVRVEPIILNEVEALDWTCPQHITPQYTEAEVTAWMHRSRHGPKNWIVA